MNAYVNVFSVFTCPSLRFVLQSLRGESMTMMKDRLRTVRKHLNLSMADFGKSIGVSYDVISNLELGRTSPSESMLRLICFTHGVNRYYLDTGEGDIFLGESSDDIADQLRVVLWGMDEFKVNTIISLVKMPDEWWNALKLMHKQDG